MKSMLSVEVTAQKDYLQKISKSKPYLAMSELIWNALDADANEVKISYVANEIDGIDKILISDNGVGFPRQIAEKYFGSLGGSWKINAIKSTSGRQLHGKHGQGRFKAFSLGYCVNWKVRYEKKDGKIYEYEISGRVAQINRFDITDEKLALNQQTGVTVEVCDLVSQFGFLSSETSMHLFPSVFAPYLCSYPDISISFDGEKMNIEEQIKEVKVYELSNSIAENGRSLGFTLKIFEWADMTSKELYFCDSAGFPLIKYDKQIRYIGDYGYSAYLNSSFFEGLVDNGELELIAMNERFTPVLQECIGKIKEYFAERYIEDQKGIIDAWKEEKVYPYPEHVDEGSVEGAEKKMFDILALNLNNHVEGFDAVNKVQKTLQFRLLKQAIETNPSDLNLILSEVIALPKKVIEELKELLEFSSLSSIISASKTITDRIKYLKGIEEIVFGIEEKKRLKERSQLHKILADNAWIFGDQFHLTVSDKSLTEVLRKHKEILDDEIVIDEPVVRLNGTVGIVDLMLSRSVPKNHADEFEYLVVELKAPKVKITQKELSQVTSYAAAVAKDERFRSLKVKWEFWILSNEVDDVVELLMRQKDAQDNAVYNFSGVNVAVKIKTWSMVLAEANHRYKFVRDQLKINIDRNEGLEYLQKTYSEYVGDFLTERKDS